MKRVIVYSDRLAGYALHLERALVVALGENPDTVEQYETAKQEKTLASLCTCGHIGSFHVPNCFGVRGDTQCECSAFEEAPSA